jgi:CDP-diacylglycerol--glycerol-3-phosphate 3-phosphatidyltransferase
MKRLWEWVKTAYVDLVDPIATLLIRYRVHPNVITTLGTCCSVAGGVIYGFGHIRTGGWFLAATALFDVLDGTVARRTGRSSVFGAFYDSTLDRVADAAVLGGLAVFYATSPRHASVGLLVIALAGVIGGFLVSYTRARAEALGVNAKVGFMQRPERVVLLSAPQALFGLALNGLVLGTIVVLLTISSWVTAIQRVIAVYRATASVSLGVDASPAVLAPPPLPPSSPSLDLPGSSRVGRPSTVAAAAGTPRPILDVK